MSVNKTDKMYGVVIFFLALVFNKMATNVMELMKKPKIEIKIAAVAIITVSSSGKIIVSFSGNSNRHSPHTAPSSQQEILFILLKSGFLSTEDVSNFILITGFTKTKGLF